MDIDILPRSLFRNGSALRRGFSLIELLSVIAILGLLASLAKIGLSSLANTQGVGRTMSEMSSLFEFAKAEAMTKNTYVWIVFVTTQNEGRNQLQVCAAASKSGLPDSSPTNLEQITKVLKFSDLNFVTQSSVQASLQQQLADIDQQIVSVATTGFEINFPVQENGTPKSFGGVAIAFTPQGEVMASEPTANSAYDPVMEMSFQQTKGLVVPVDRQEGILLLWGGNAKARIFRP